MTQVLKRVHDPGLYKEAVEDIEGILENISRIWE